MGFNRKQLQILINQPRKIWAYMTDDTASTVLSRGYFNDPSVQFAVGDWIFVTTSTRGMILHVNEIDPLELQPIQCQTV